MAGSIKISPKHGLNPCMPVCAFCGQEKDTIALMGRLKGDAEAPMSAVIDYKPCDECLANWAKGVALIRVTSKSPARDAMPFTERDGVKLFPTGQYSVITTDAAKRLFGMDAKAGSPVLMEDGAFDSFMEDARSQGVV